MTYKFKYRENGTVIAVEDWDVKEMIKNSDEWECLDDVSRVVLGEAADVVLQNIPKHTLTLKKNGNRQDVA